MMIIIKSQNKRSLVKCENVFIWQEEKDTNTEKNQIRGNYDSENGWVLGEYKSEKRCLQIMDEIVKHIDYVTTTDNKVSPVYQMPEK